MSIPRWWPWRRAYRIWRALARANTAARVDSTGVVHNESLPGLVGLAPGWATGPLDTAGQEWVTSCMAARLNAYGVSVMLSKS